MKSTKDLVIIGGGISGLSAAFYAHKLNIDFVLLESSSRFGGVVWTENQNGYLHEKGPGSLVIGECLSEIISEVGSKAILANKKAKHKVILSEGKLHQITKPFYPFISDFLSWETKLAILKEVFSQSISAKDSEEETVKEFFERKFNTEFLYKLIHPILTGIYAGNPSKLSIKAIWPRIYEIDKKYGSLIRGFFTEAISGKAKRSSREIYSFEGALGEFIESLVQKLPNERLKLNSSVRKVTDLTNQDNQYLVELSNGETVEAKNVICATPAYITAQLMPDYFMRLDEVEYSPVVTINCWVNRPKVSTDFQKLIEESFGFLSAKDSESKKILGVIFNSSLFPNRAPEEIYSLTCFVGGSQFPEVVNLSEQEIKDICINELNKILQIKEPAVDIRLINRWEKAVPQLNIGHLKLIENILSKLPKGVTIAGNYVEGVSIEQAAMSGKKAVQKLAEKHH